MKKQLLKWSFLFLGTAAFSLTACNKEDGIEANEEEVITTMQLTFTAADGSNPLVYKFEDLDGDGSNTTQDVIQLAANKTYNVTLQLLNKSVTPAEDITAEVAAEGASHRLYYTPSAGSNIAVTNLNNDDEGNPLGITSTWATSSAANGTMQITLRHYPGNPPNKQASDALNSSKSSTDIEVTFTTRVQ